MRYGYIFITQYVPTVDRLAYGSYDSGTVCIVYHTPEYHRTVWYRII